MGPATIKVRIRRHKESTEFAEGDFYVDSGLAYAVVPERMLRDLGVDATGQETMFLANGEKVVRKTGDAYFELCGKGGYSRVMFGEPDDVNLVGVITLEALGLVLDPFTRELKPVPTLLTW